MTRVLNKQPANLETTVVVVEGVKRGAEAQKVRRSVKVVLRPGANDLPDAKASALLASPQAAVWRRAGWIDVVTAGKAKETTLQKVTRRLQEGGASEASGPSGKKPGKGGDAKAPSGEGAKL